MGDARVGGLAAVEPHDSDQVNVAAALDALDAAAKRLQAIDGKDVPEGPGRAVSAALADLAKELMYAAHLCARAEVEVLHEYHRIRGYADLG